MKKRILAMLLCITALLSISGCGLTSSILANSKPERQKISCNAEQLEVLMAEQPVYISSTKYSEQSDKYKTLYPDMLQAILKNNSQSDVKSAVVAFVAWDANNLPVKIKGNIDFSDGSYVKKVNYTDINMVPGGTYGNQGGFEVDSSLGIASFKACVVSYETFEGEKWKNPYFDEWSKLYSGVKYDPSATVEVEVEETGAPAATVPEAKAEDVIDAATLQAEIDKQSVRVISTKYVEQSDKYKTLYPDMLQAVVKNDSQSDIKSVVVAFVAWDENNLPVKIKGKIDFSDGSYVKKASYDGANIVPGSTYGSDKGLEIDEFCKIKTFKAIVVSYTTFEDTTWDNPLFTDWCTLYEDVKLAE